MFILLVGTNHKICPIEVREKIAISTYNLPLALGNLRKIAQESLILSTCNRTEIYILSSKKEEGFDKIINFLENFKEIKFEGLKNYFYQYKNETAIEHLFSVACGLNSMIIGEGQILGQIKEAFSSAINAENTGKAFNKLFNLAIKAGKRARSETLISQGATSISFAAVELAKKIFGELQGRKILLIGAGKMSELTLKLLIKAGISFVIVANRTYDNAFKLAEKYDGGAIKFDEINEELKNADIIISSTGAPRFILNKEKLIPCMKARKNRPLFLIDIAVPRDINPDVNDLDNVYLYNIDDLENVVKENIDDRIVEIEKVKKIIKEEMEGFFNFFYSQEAIPIIKNLNEYIENIRKLEIEKLNFKDSSFNKEDLERFSRSFAQKILHLPLTKIKKIAKGENSSKNLEIVKSLFEFSADGENNA